MMSSTTHLRISLPLFASALMACSNAGAPAPAEPRSWTVSPAAYGPLSAGMTLRQISRVLREQVIVPPDTMNGGCGYVYPKIVPAGVSLMVAVDTIVRVDVDTTGVRTAEGIGVGDAERHVLDVYAGRVAVQPHPYDDDGHYLVVDALDDSLHRVIFETSNARVERYRAGRRPEVDFIEGCS